MSVPPFTRVLHSWAGVSRSVAEVNRGGTNGRHEDGERWTDTEQRKHMVVSIGWPLSSPPFSLIVYHSCRSLTSRSLHFHFVRRWRGGGKWKKWTTEAPTEARGSGDEWRWDDRTSGMSEVWARDTSNGWSEEGFSGPGCLGRILTTYLCCLDWSFILSSFHLPWLEIRPEVTCKKLVIMRIEHKTLETPPSIPP